MTIGVSYSGRRSWDGYALSADTGTVKGLSWTGNNPSDGVYHWDNFDKYRADLISEGREGVYTFGNKPAWVSDEPTSFGTYVTAIVARAAGQGFRIWELWNEPNAGVNARTGAQIAALAAIAYPIIKAADPGATVLSPAPNGNGSGWFSDFLAAGGNAHFDVVALHLYCDPGPGVAAASGGLNATINSYKALLATNGIQKPVWCTEFSEHGYWFTGDDITRPEDERDYIGQMLPYLWGHGIARVYWYAWDGGEVTGTLWTGVGSNRNVAGVAWDEMRGWLRGARRIGSVGFNGDVGSLRLIRSGYEARIVWHYKGSSDFTIPAGTYTRYRDLAGNVTAIDGATTTVPITNSAILIETGAP